MNWLNRFSIIQLTLIGASIILLFLLVVVGKDVSRSVKQSSLANEDKHLIEMLTALEQVAHHHAVERGLTAGFLGAKSQQARDKVLAQREKADAAEAKLTQMLQTKWPSEYNLANKVAVVKSLLAQKSKIRDQVDKLDGSNAFAFYSQLNKAALDAASSLTLNIYSAEATSDLTHALQLAWLKERLGQVRGKVNGTLAQKAVAPAALSEIQSYQRDINYIADVLNNVLPNDKRKQFQQAANSANAQLMADVVNRLKQPTIDFSALPSSTEWFTAATAQIGEIKQLLDQQWVLINRLADHNVTEATTALAYLIGGTVAVLLLIAVIYIAMAKTLKMQLRELVVNLDRVAQHGDLTVKITMETKNELGEISRHVNKTIWALKDLVLGLDKSLKVANRISDDLYNSTSVVLDDANATQQKAIDISSAIEEMATTSEEIARSAVDTLEASQQLDRVANNSIAANEAIKSAMKGLTEEMGSVALLAKDMGRQMSEISSILDTINTLSEQTNLLALNAAIEAARAGEHGRGFAVVADEVRQLAMASRESTDKISKLLDSLNQASDGVINGINQNADKASQSLDITEEGEKTAHDVKDSAANVEQLANSMSTAAEQQSVTAGQIAKDIVAVQEAATKEYKLAKELNLLASDLQKNNQVLQRTMDYFTVN